MVIVRIIDITLFSGFAWVAFYAPYRALKWVYKKLAITR